MKKLLKLENVEIGLVSENGNVRVRTNSADYGVKLINQNVDAVSELLAINFEKVSKFFKARAMAGSAVIKTEHINNISIQIVLHYLYMYNMWLNTRKKIKDTSLVFKDGDFDDPTTFDIVVRLVKKLYPVEWEVNSSILTGKSLEQFVQYYREREKFYNK